MTVHLKYCTIEQLVGATWTLFTDGTSCHVGDEADAIRRAAAKWVGLENDLPRYNYEHEVIHAFLAEKMFDAPSPVQWNMAHGRKGNIVAGRYEERWVYHFQRYLCGMSEQVVEDEWPVWREEARRLLDLTSHRLTGRGQCPTM
jgi:hypothetical protein